jgi:sulfur-oxidizing protein SoxZ
MATKSKHKMRARLRDGVVDVRVLIQHPMETGNRKDPITGLKVPRLFIRELVCEHNGKPVMRTQWSWGMARNPYLGLHLKGAAKGDKVRLYWMDSAGVADAVESVVR